MTMQHALKNSHVTCPECQMGSYFLKLTTYYTWMGDTMITVPDFPCWVCDSCKHSQFDQKAIGQLKILLQEGVGKSVDFRLKSGQSPVLPPRTRRPGQLK